MSYIKVKWLHQNPDEPTVLYSELDEARWEKRKIDLFADGTACIATEEDSFGGPGLSTLAIPPLQEIAADPQFQPEEISEAEFVEAWNIAKSNLRRSD